LIRRFRGTLGALVVLIVVAVVALTIERRPPPVPDLARPDAVFRFEKDDLVGFAIDRPDLHLEVRRVDGTWTVDNQPWRPSRSMVRRVAHQLHDLDARADVAQGGEGDPALARYGLDEEAARIRVSLADGRELRFVVGDPNPTSVSVYLQVLDAGATGDGGGRVYVVKKAAMDFWRSPLEAFREDRITMFDADAAARLRGVIDGEPLDIERIGDRVYRMHQPVDQPASRDAVRTMLGRISALRAVSFVRDQPQDLGGWGLDPPRHTLSVTLDSGERVDLRLGDEVAGTDPPQRYVYYEQDDAVYAVRDGMLDSFRKTPDELRDRSLIGRHEWDVASLEVERPDEGTIAIHRTSDGWRWADRAAIAGSTPKRVAGRAAELQAVAFRDGDDPAEHGLAPPRTTVRLRFDDDAEVTVRLGDRFEVPGPDVPPPPAMPGQPAPPPAPPAPRTLGRQHAQVGDGPVVEVDGALGDAIDDLFREHGRKVTRDEEKGLEP
jgi:hypothetical protein